MSGSIRQHKAVSGEPAPKDPNPCTPTEAFRKSVIRLRKRYGWRQVDLAKRAGLSRAILRNIENGQKSSITIDEMFSISAALGTSPAHLVAPPDGADLEVLAGDKPEVVTAQIMRAWLGGRGWVRADDLPHMPAALHADDCRRREELEFLHLVQRTRSLLAEIDEALDPESEATAAVNERLTAWLAALDATAQAFAQRNARVASRQRIRKAA